MSYKIKVITGFRKDQYYSISAEEAHKAYYLFLNPEKRSIFSNGVALIGSNIQGIEPDYNGTMGWNPDHTLDSDDWNELREKGVDRKLRDYLYKGKEIAQLEPPQKMSLPLTEIIKSYENKNPLLDNNKKAS